MRRVVAVMVAVCVGGGALVAVGEPAAALSRPRAVAAFGLTGNCVDWAARLPALTPWSSSPSEPKLAQQGAGSTGLAWAFATGVGAAGSVTAGSIGAEAAAGAAVGTGGTAALFLLAAAGGWCVGSMLGAAYAWATSPPYPEGSPFAGASSASLSPNDQGNGWGTISVTWKIPPASVSFSSGASWGRALATVVVPGDGSATQANLSGYAPLYSGNTGTCCRASGPFGYPVPALRGYPWLSKHVIGAGNPFSADVDGDGLSWAEFSTDVQCPSGYGVGCTVVPGTVAELYTCVGCLNNSYASAPLTGSSIDPVNTEGTGVGNRRTQVFVPLSPWVNQHGVRVRQRSVVECYTAPNFTGWNTYTEDSDAFYERDGLQSAAPQASCPTGTIPRRAGVGLVTDATGASSIKFTDFPDVRGTSRQACMTVGSICAQPPVEGPSVLDQAIEVTDEIASDPGPETEPGSTTTPPTTAPPGTGHDESIPDRNLPAAAAGTSLGGCIEDKGADAGDGVTWNPVTWIVAVVDFVWVPIYCVLLWLLVPPDGWAALFEEVADVVRESPILAPLVALGSALTVDTGGGCLPVSMHDFGPMQLEVGPIDAFGCDQPVIGFLWVLVFGLGAFGVVGDLIGTVWNFQRLRASARS